jgi:hypothetical protein
MENLDFVFHLDRADIPYDGRIRTLDDKHGSARLIFIFTDVSNEKKLQRELIIKKSTKLMFSCISHELRTPINGKDSGSFFSNQQQHLPAEKERSFWKRHPAA